MTRHRDRVLVLSNDHSLAAAKTSRFLATALERLGCRAIVRDTGLVRWAIGQLEDEFVSRRTAYEIVVVSKWNKFFHDYGIDRIVSLDLHWLFSSKAFLDFEHLRGIHSFWFDDLRSNLKSAAMFPLAPQSAMDLLNHRAVSHHCYGDGQADEMRLLGLNQVRRSALAAPAEYLKETHPCTVKNKLAFVGNPGLSNPPSQGALDAMNRGENLCTLRKLAAEELLESLRNGPSPFGIDSPREMLELMSAAVTARQKTPHVSALRILSALGESYPLAFTFLNETGLILDAALLVKTVQRYDRPALVHRLWKHGLLDVFGTPEQWLAYGITAEPTVSFPQLPEIYQRYVAHLNAPNCARDATANEKLFEIAACGRVSINLESPDVQAAYSPEEVAFLADDEALIETAERLIREPDLALEMGQRAQKRTVREHLWEHRMAGALATT